MLPGVLRIGKTRIDPVVRTDSYEIHIKRDDRIFFSQGTKIRKLFGIYESLLPSIESGLCKKVLLQGNLHSNAILAGVLFFRHVGVPTKVLGYSRDGNLVSPASLVARRFSELELYPSRKEWERAVEDTTKVSLSLNQLHLNENSTDNAARNLDRTSLESKLSTRNLNSTPSRWDDKAENPNSSGDLLLPEYFFCQESLNGLSSLWEEIDPNSFDHVVLDVGSGLTWLSAILWGKLPITGICLGLNREKTVLWLQENLSSLRQTLPSLAWNSLVEPKDKLRLSFSFGKKDGFWEEKAREYERKFGIYLEPIYSAKTFSVLEEMAKSDELNGRILYVYQGGILQGMNL
ncbi:1-aminocyclopropane-1-carboxylate deaminase [Leptospira semungkisensis]|uniref:1-aminocyclopropane-1-carboxylate deaminase n=1 Tax=Leptospira semungkisensis TaxID=2484985 RepID=A0A4R9FL30_9LEPT|nr:1-aminocyclopropane-1-carboxylate deaminase [Leptospira semungkisensis]TGJ99345.1 1-aminocyclopropane-1-carboxylate deaminase [Leptospira semungkisensis]